MSIFEDLPQVNNSFRDQSTLNVNPAEFEGFDALLSPNKFSSICIASDIYYIIILFNYYIKYNK